MGADKSKPCINLLVYLFVCVSPVLVRHDFAFVGKFWDGYRGEKLLRLFTSLCYEYSKIIDKPNFYLD